MSKEETKKHFSEICECIWNKIDRQNKLDQKEADVMHKIVAQLVMFAWNMSILQTSYTELKKKLKQFAAVHYDNSPHALTPLIDAAELKWRDYRNDSSLIVSTEVKLVAGKPHAVAYLKEERPDIDNVTKPFKNFINSPEIQERLKHTPPEKLEEEIGKIIAEYNASLPKPEPFVCDDSTAEECIERDFPITRKELDCTYQFMQNDAPQEKKDKTLTPLLKHLSFLARLCKTSSTASAISDIIMTVASVYLPDTDLIEYGMKAYKQGLKMAEPFVSAYIRDEDEFYAWASDCAEPDLIIFLTESVSDLNLSQKEFKKTLSTLLAWGFMVEAARAAKNPDKYPQFDENNQEEHYDFDQKNLRLFFLHVKLRGFRVSVDLTVPEDTTFDQLHTVLNSIFKRDDDHLYRFECDDGCTAVRDEEELEDSGAVLSDKCYLGHHLEIGSKVFYLFDYGDEWEHDITVKKVVEAEPKNCHIEVLKITGEIPEQYPDYDEEDE